MLGPLERREACRYPMACDLHYEVLYRGEIAASGAGKVQDVSATGIFFKADKVMRSDSLVRLRIQWPVQPEGPWRLEWVVGAKVLRSTNEGTAVRIMHYQFVRHVNI